MSESEVRGLCLKSREIFLQQPILLELEAPLKICGKFKLLFYKIKRKFLSITLSLDCEYVIIKEHLQILISLVPESDLGVSFM